MAVKFSVSEVDLRGWLKPGLFSPTFQNLLFPQIRLHPTWQELQTVMHTAIAEYLHIMNVAVKPAIEGTKLRAHQNEGLGYPGSLQESVQIIHHPARQQHSSLSAQNRDIPQTVPGLFIQLTGPQFPGMKHE